MVIGRHKEISARVIIRMARLLSTKEIKDGKVSIGRQRKGSGGSVSMKNIRRAAAKRTISQNASAIFRKRTRNNRSQSGAQGGLTLFSIRRKYGAETTGTRRQGKILEMLADFEAASSRQDGFWRSGVLSTRTGWRRSVAEAGLGFARRFCALHPTNLFCCRWSDIGLSQSALAAQ